MFVHVYLCIQHTLKVHVYVSVFFVLCTAFLVALYIFSILCLSVPLPFCFFFYFFIIIIIAIVIIIMNAVK